MKKIFFFGLLFIATASFAKAPTIEEVRVLYQKSVSDEDACKELIQILDSDKTSPLYLGYRGCATMMMAKHVFNPFSKISYFRKGRDILENAIKEDEKNFELRYLRFIAQTNMPSFLGYYKSIGIDKQFILNTFSQIKDVSLREYVLPVLQKSKSFTNSEKERFR